MGKYVSKIKTTKLQKQRIQENTIKNVKIQKNKIIKCLK